MSQETLSSRKGLPRYRIARSRAAPGARPLRRASRYRIGPPARFIAATNDRVRATPRGEKTVPRTSFAGAIIRTTR
jgi:hypothetical protein